MHPAAARIVAPLLLLAAAAPRSTGAAAYSVHKTARPAFGRAPRSLSLDMPPAASAARVPLSAVARSRPHMLISSHVLAAGVGGTLAGGLHALTGPDHVACVLPICVGRRWWSAIYTGAYWGLGHGIGAMLVGALGYAVKGYFNLDAFAQWGEVAVGLSILVIGILGLKETSAWREGDPDSAPGVVAAQAVVDGSAVAIAAPSHTSSLLTGVIHGCSGSGHLLGVLPALAMPSLRTATAYLCMFGLGTMVAMSIFTAAVGEISVRMGQTLDRPDLPAKMTVFSSGFACVVGAIWTAKAISALPSGSFVALSSTVGRALSRLILRS